MTQSEFETEWKNDEDFVVCHTSGSTGTPKEIKLGKEFMRQSAWRTIDFFGITDSSRLHTCLDFQYIASKMMAVRADEANCLLSSETPSNRPLQDIGPKETITLLSVVPSQMQWLLDHLPSTSNKQPTTDNRQPTTDSRQPIADNILIGGSPIPPMMRRRIALSGLNAWESYGMTETASHIALRKVVEDETLPFKTLSEITVESDDSGCLVINIPGVEKFVTNDLAKVISPNEFLIFGRADNCIISGGVKILPELLEASLGPFIAFRYCISSLPDSKWGERLIIAVEKNGSCLSDEIIKKAVAVRLEQFKKSLNLGVKAPKEVVIVDSFPLTANGKLDRSTLRLSLKSN